MLINKLRVCKMNKKYLGRVSLPSFIADIFHSISICTLCYI